jgi:hypothetical protein
MEKGIVNGKYRLCVVLFKKFCQIKSIGGAQMVPSQNLLCLSTGVAHAFQINPFVRFCGVTQETLTRSEA